VTLLEDSSLDAGPGSFAAKVTVTTRSGTTYVQRTDYAKGSPQNPMVREDIDAKFLSLATRVLPEVQATRIIAAVRDLDNVADVSTLAALLSASGAPGSAARP
jgi:2-methylcitrate dehydratase PrpD